MDMKSVDQIISKTNTDNTINLALGKASQDVLKGCCEIFKEGIGRTLQREILGDGEMFQYIPVTGSDDWKDQVSIFLSQVYGYPVLKDNLVQTCSSLHGMYLVLSTLLDMNGVLFLDELSYALGWRIFHQFSSLQVVPVAFDSVTGLDFADLKRKVIEKRFTPCKGKLFWGFYYTMTVFHNPSGLTFSEDLCRKLVELARQENLLIASDDASNLLIYNDEKPPKRLFSYDDPKDEDYQGNVVSFGTFSKILAPGVRLGWVECPQRIAKEFDEASLLIATGAANQFISFIVANLIREGLLQQHFSRVKLGFKVRVDAFCGYLRENLPEVEVKNPGGGCFLWLKFPEAFPVKDFVKFLADQHQLYVSYGPTFSTNPQKFNNFCRIICNYHDPSTLRIGAKKFCSSFREFDVEHKKRSLIKMKL